MQDLVELSDPIEYYQDGINIVVTGKELGGKTSFVHLFVKKLYPDAADRKRRILLLDAATMDETMLLSKMDGFKRFFDHPKTKPHPKFPYIVIENFHQLNPRIQQHSIGPQWEILNAKGIFFVLTVAPDANKVTEQIKTTSKIVRLRPLEDLHVLEKVLMVCVNQRIGFVRPALDYIVKRLRHAVGPCLVTLQQLFTTHHYLSMENVNRFFHRTLHMKESLDLVEMSAPLKRCKVCTLVPPCAHTTLDHIHNRVLRLRAMYPQDNQRDVCPDFKHTGLCHVFNRKGRCMYDHPMEIHAIDTTKLVARCKIHTLPLPCTHCATLATSVAREVALAKEKSAVETMIIKLKKMLADQDHALHAHVKATSATVVWGKAKEIIDAKTADLMDDLKKTQSKLEHLQRHVTDEIIPVLEALHLQNQRGYCKGLGKGGNTVDDLGLADGGDSHQGEE
ncbi:hypothetical protein, variant 1 [Aphanomyces invadans]|nr:hypothetical protein, variant 1 [Aphanomyces invadans]ETW04849.1 hypothetical protein, variant 1 [Aphanomyces invadans]|eukprot:XP_008866286.1 hypothetical protein, variant 1 [Aphanomyces invadans]